MIVVVVGLLEVVPVVFWQLLVWLVLVDVGKASSKVEQSNLWKKGRNLDEKRKKPRKKYLPLCAAWTFIKLAILLLIQILRTNLIFSSN